jgi:hypothetical protein
MHTLGISVLGTDRNKGSKCSLVFPKETEVFRRRTKVMEVFSDHTTNEKES